MVMETLQQFEWHHLVQALGLLVSFILTQGGIVPFIDKLKGWLGVSGRWTTVLVVGVVTLWTVINLTTQGIITPEALNPVNFFATLLFVLERTQTEYMRIRNQE